MPINTLESIPEDYKIDYSNDTKIIFNDNDDMDVIGDDVDELQEDEFIQAKLPKYPQRKKSSNNNDFFSNSEVTITSPTCQNKINQSIRQNKTSTAPTHKYTSTIPTHKYTNTIPTHKYTSTIPLSSENDISFSARAINTAKIAPPSTTLTATSPVRPTVVKQKF